MDAAQKSELLARLLARFPGLAELVTGDFEGVDLWRELHERALAYTGNQAAEVIWLNALARRIPCGECRRGYVAWKQANPPNLASSDAYFDWSIRLHNAVNAKLGRDEWSVNAARERWSG